MLTWLDHESGTQDQALISGSKQCLDSGSPFLEALLMKFQSLYSYIYFQWQLQQN